jgi:hypothetical protein
MRTVTDSSVINASPETVFRYVDDIRNTGWHMTKASMPLMGSKLNLEILSENSSGEGATYRWYGKVMGFTIDFKESVTKWIANKEKRWKTVGEPRLVIISNYEMWLLVEPIAGQTRLTFGINYDLPKPLFGRFLGWLLADWYCKWCLRHMTADTKRVLEGLAGGAMEAPT